MRRPLILLLAAAVVALGPASGAWAGTGARPSEVAKIDARIADARSNLRGWRAWLADWSSRVDAAQRAAWELGNEVNLQREPVLAGGALRPGSNGALMSADAALQGAQLHLDALLNEPRATAALQQVFAWQDYLGELQRARQEIVTGVPAVTVPGGPPTFDSWARLFLRRIGAPACGDNLAAVVAWETAESTSAAFNPLATTRTSPGSTAMNGVGVQNFASLDQGLWATADTLASGASGYGDIVAALQACAPADATVAAINASAWCAGCAGGAYVADMLTLVRADYPAYAGRLISTTAA